MRKKVITSIACMAVIFMLGGCATGPRFSEVENQFTTLRQGEGRIFFFRPHVFGGAAVQPEIKLNGVAVGRSQPNGFFYVDRPAGSYLASAATEVEDTLRFDLAAGEIKYFRTAISMGLFIGHVTIYPDAPDRARALMGDMAYTGTNNFVSTGPATPARAPAPPPALIAASPAVQQQGIAAPVPVGPAAPAQKPPGALHLEPGTVANTTWVYAHRDAFRFGDVEINFGPDSSVTARNRRSQTAGHYRVENDRVCLTTDHRDWGSFCYYLVKDDAGLSVVQQSGRKVPVSIR